MFSWLRRRREKARRAKVGQARPAGADRLAGDSEARPRQEYADSAEVFAQWDRVLEAVSRLTGRPIGLDTASTTAAEADLSDAEPAKGDFEGEPDLVEELERLLRAGRG